MSDLTRAFIAVPLPAPVRRFLAQTQTELHHIESGIRWVQPENIHLTIKFLGELKPNKFKQVMEYVQHIPDTFKPFDLTLDGLEVFPRAEAPRII